MKYLTFFINRVCSYFSTLLKSRIFFGKSLNNVPENSIIFFPYRTNVFYCGIAGIVSFKNKKNEPESVDIVLFENYATNIEKYLLHAYKRKNLKQYYWGGKDLINDFLNVTKTFKKENKFYTIFTNNDYIKQIEIITKRLNKIIKSESKILSENIETLDKNHIEIISSRLENIKDITSSLSSETLNNINNIKKLVNNERPPFSQFIIFKNINAVLNSIDRLEVRGRDSAGLSLFFVFDKIEYEKFQNALDDKNKNELYKRINEPLKTGFLGNRAITITNTSPQFTAIVLTYKIAAEIGNLGDNIKFLRSQIENDSLLQTLSCFSIQYHTVLSHTRWASVGDITEANCHPVDSTTIPNTSTKKTWSIYVCLNGDIDNYLDLKKEFELSKNSISKSITTDAKIIPLQIKKYLQQGFEIEESFRLAVNDFKGSHAISMHTDLAPDKIFLAQKGSGQTLFVGIADTHYMPASEVYGFVEETPYFIKMDGNHIVKSQNGTCGQIFILSQETNGGLEGIQTIYYDGSPVELTEADIKSTDITSRDIDRQGYPHYFLKEIYEAPTSVERTLLNHWEIIKKSGQKQYNITLDENTFPSSLKKAFLSKQIERIFFVGQGTAGVAATCCANILQYYINESDIRIQALKASELSGFILYEHDKKDSLKDTLVVAISQSGATTDTNKTVDMVKERGAYTIGIVNRRDSDLTFKVDGILYTSNSRDIEMSVASTKAFYSQITAGAILGLYLVSLNSTCDDDFIKQEINQLCEIPLAMRKILTTSKKIKRSADKLALTKTYWAAVGSGPNKASSDEIRIKLSELCYKTISSDYTEDKKHIDLSSEPLIIISAAGTRENVKQDIIKDTAIFSAHKATTIVITDEGDNRFDPYAEDVFHVPAISEHFAPILNTFVGHLWGYFAALAINEVSKYLYGFRENIKNIIENFAKQNFDVYEAVLQDSFQEKIERFSIEFKAKKIGRRFPALIGFEAASDITLLLKYLSGKLSISDFEFDFDIKGTALNMLNCLFRCLDETIDLMTRPIDAIKHQAKTVTVGTSRISEKVEGIFFDALDKHNITTSMLTTKNVIVLKNLQKIVSNINGYILYKVDKLNLMGKPVDNTTISIVDKGGILKQIPSRVEKDDVLRGTKRTIIIQGNVYIAKGRKDDRNILVIPIISSSASQPNWIERILLLNISFKKNTPLSTKIKALGPKFEFLKNIVQESIPVWKDEYIDLVATHVLFGRSAEKTGELIVSLLATEVE